MSKLHAIEENMLAFECPGCGYWHHATVNGKLNESGASWEWNGSMDTPTFSPSLLVNGSMPQHRCHSFVKDGNIQYLADCFHELAGQTVALPEWED